MPKLPPALIERNASLVAEANPLYDQINQNWEKIEAFLKSSGVLAPVAFWYGNDGGNEQYAIGIQKLSGKWRVCTGYSNVQDPEDREYWTPISDTSLDERVAMLDYIPPLFNKLVESNAAAVVKLAEAVKKSSDALKTLGIS